MSDQDYLHRRFVEEWERADAAAHPDVRRVHLNFAEAYLDRLDGPASRARRRPMRPPLRRSLA